MADSAVVDLARVKGVRDIDNVIATIEQAQGDLMLMMDALEGAPPERVREVARKIAAAAQQANAFAITGARAIRMCLKA